MDDRECVGFLQWALPELHMRWAGFRKVRRQVCKRVSRRLQLLQLRDSAAYREFLQRNPEEWAVLDGLCRVSISRFWRDRSVFAALQTVLLPELVQGLRRRGGEMLRVWSAGCGAGEEPYSLSILWELDTKRRVADARVKIEIVASDSDESMIDRATAACYRYSSIKELPGDWRLHAFFEQDEKYCLRGQFRQGVNFVCQDVRVETPPGRFDLVLCRNLAFTYFDDELQRKILQCLAGVLQAGGILIVGIHEFLPGDYEEFEAWSQRLGIYRRR